MDLLLNVLLVVLDVDQLGTHLTHDLHMRCRTRATLRPTGLIVF
jgi:hypothetical protein